MFFYRHFYFWLFSTQLPLWICVKTPLVCRYRICSYFLLAISIVIVISFIIICPYKNNPAVQKFIPLLGSL